MVSPGGGTSKKHGSVSDVIELTKLKTTAIIVVVEILRSLARVGINLFEFVSLFVIMASIAGGFPSYIGYGAVMLYFIINRLDKYDLNKKLIKEQRSGAGNK